MDMKPTHPHDFGPTPKFNNIPEELKEGKWCVWKAKPRKRPDGSIKYDKIPYNGLQAISTAKPDTWLDFNTAQQLYEQGGYNGVGRLAQKDGLTFIDIDNTTKLPDEIKQLGETYCEKSPSGTGWRLVYRTDTPPSQDITSPFEVYSGNSARFLTITGNVIVDAPIANKNGQIATLVSKHSPSTNQTQDDPFASLIKTDITPDKMRKTLAKISADDDHTWVKVAAALHFEFDGSDEGFQLFDEWSKTSPKYEENGTTGKTTRSVWDRQSTDKSSLITFRSILQMAKETSHQEYDTEEYEALLKQTDIPDNLFVPLTNDFQTDPHIVRWTVEKYLEHGVVANFYGESGVGKSYLAIDFGLSVATGSDWLGMRTKQGHVLYIAGEGHTGANRRAYAWRSERDFPDASNFIMTSRALNLTQDKDRKLLEAQMQQLDTTLVIVDTWGRATAGINENSSEDVQPVIEYLGHLTRKYNCTVMIVHHTPKHTTDASAGSKNIKGSMDVEMALVRREGVEGVVLECRKMKEGAEFAPLVFTFVPIRLPSNYNDEYGNETYSAVLRKVEGGTEIVQQSRGYKKLNAKGKLTLEAFEYLDRHHPEMQIQTPNGLVVDSGPFDLETYGYDEDVLKAEVGRRMDSSYANPRDQLRKHIQNAIDAGKLVRYEAEDGSDSSVIVRLTGG